MKELTLKEIKQKELELLLMFHNQCIQHGWRYSLCGGSLLGAVRHKGFIPWDDDIDVFMPRPDYDKLVEYSKGRDLGFNVLTHDTTPGYNHLEGKVSLRGTKIIDEELDLSAYELGIYVDIFPVDGLGNSYEEAKKTFYRTAFQRELLNARTWKRYSRSKTHSVIYEPIRLGMFILSRFVTAEHLMNSIDDINRKKSFDAESYCGSVYGSYRTKEIQPHDVFASCSDMLFEGEVLRGLTNYDAWLSNIYGDYMKLPPKEKQVSHHTFKAYSTEKT